MISTSVSPRIAARRPRLAGWLGRGLDTHISLPLFAVLLVIGLWILTLRVIDADRAATLNAAHAATRERVETYEAQMARSLNGIDQTLKVLKYAVELNGAEGAIPALRQQDLLPPGLVFVVSVADRNGHVNASNPDQGVHDVSGTGYFLYHRNNDLGLPFVSATMGDGARAEPHLHFTRRINDRAGRFAGIAIVAADPSYFTSAYERSRDGEHGMLGLAGIDGVMRALRVGEHVSWGQRIELGTSEGGIALHTGPDGIARYTSVQRLHGFPLAIVVGLARHEQFAAFEEKRRTYLLAAASASALLLLVVAVIAGWAWQLARVRRRARRAQETYAAASEGSLDAFFVLRALRQPGSPGSGARIVDFVVEATNTRAEGITGLPRAEMQGMLLCDMLPHYRDNGIFDDLAAATEDGQPREGEWQASTRQAAGRWLHRQIVAVENGVVVIVRDITERKQVEARIFHMAHHDELTGLPNRNLMHDRIEHAVSNAARNGNAVALAFVDLDGFKLVNDGLGHKAGDELLKVIGKRMGACLRRSDTLARFGGDEFVILLPDQGHDPDALAPLLEKIRVAVTEPVQVSGQAVQVSCSMGVVMYPRDGMDASALLMNADAAMYRAKDLGSNNFQFYAREMNASIEEKLVLLDGLRQAVQATFEGAADNGFRLLYQPKVDLRSGRVFGVEALIRWQHPEHGMVPPQRFIGLAEESGLIVEIGDWVIREACRQARAWVDAGLPPVTMSVNVSARQFEEARLVERVACALRDSRLAPELLELEVTESLIMRDLTRSVARMRELEAMGVSLSIDDFGTGYSSLSSLKTFPISRLKIDKSFVSELADNPDDQAIAMAVISLGHKLNLRVIAEGVETEQQRAFLRANECDEMQGYLFSKPVSADDIVDMLEVHALEMGAV
ncbi:MULTISPECIES: EAL domain-containing protein [unclassified Massilia]|uniref:bifunctional diguanylate cyclase/phosphodiesterase n=1 Tax=unclassified Massilia TaxID=2609279 RepID=UPI00177E5088|nr:MULTISPECIES: EAL domain-containing protein [unclassified Massilia]MBD8533349.1 EAL domain-containing protein [Massilia sp. CFBP 13647]MBD8676742.1 EAL domain-containing protein [Massilia sp. CFBP 13721]